MKFVWQANLKNRQANTHPDGEVLAIDTARRSRALNEVEQ
jgi:hypothetical protein